MFPNMLSRCSFHLFVVTVVAHLCAGDQQSDMEKLKKCPRPDWALNLYIHYIMGEWYPQLTTNKDDLEEHCVTYVFTASPRRDGNFFWIRNNAVAVITRFERTSEFHMNIKDLIGIWLVDCDYSSWSVWFICNSENPTAGDLIITTRQRAPNALVMQAAEAAAKRFSPDLFKLLKVANNTACVDPPEHKEENTEDKQELQ